MKYKLCVTCFWNCNMYEIEASFGNGAFDYFQMLILKFNSLVRKSIHVAIILKLLNIIVIYVEMHFKLSQFFYAPYKSKLKINFLVPFGSF